MSTEAVPRVAVITATHNAEGTLGALFASLQAQSFRYFEWIVVDGASTDGTLAMLERFAARHEWVKCISEADFGVYDALNKGVQRCEAPFYLVAGADDRFESDALQKFVDVFESSGADVVLADVMIEGRRRGGFFPRRAWLGPPRVFAGSHSVGIAFRKELHARFGRYTPQFPLLADSFFLKVLLRSGEVRFHRAKFVAGEFAKGGLTTRGKAQILAETWQIQLLTERSPLFQTLLFLGKLAIRMPDVLHEVRQRLRGGS